MHLGVCLDTHAHATHTALVPQWASKGAGTAFIGMNFGETNIQPGPMGQVSGPSRLPLVQRWQQCKVCKSSRHPRRARMVATTRCQQGAAYCGVARSGRAGDRGCCTAVTGIGIATGSASGSVHQQQGGDGGIALLRASPGSTAKCQGAKERDGKTQCAYAYIMCVRACPCARGGKQTRMKPNELMRQLVQPKACMRLRDEHGGQKRRHAAR